MKTPEELAEEYTNDWWGNLPEAEGMRKSARENFLAGYRAAKNSASIDTIGIDTGTKMQWISVKDRLPEIVPTQGMTYWLTSTCVLIATKEKTTHVAHLTHWIREPEADWAACACDTPGHDVEPERWKLSEVTHWMPLPAPPKEEK